MIRESDQKTLWYIQFFNKLDNGSLEGKQLDSFTYGIVPEGFEESGFPFTRLRSGETITIVIDTYTGYRQIGLTLE